MLKRMLIVLTMSVALIVAIEPLQSVQGVILSPAEVARMEAANVAAPRGGQSDGGNSFVRALKAPFRAIGRLFGRGKNDNKLQRISQKDIKKFESATANQTNVTNATNVAQTNPAPNPAAVNTTTQTASDTTVQAANQGNQSGDIPNNIANNVPNSVPNGQPGNQVNDQIHIPAITQTANQPTNLQLIAREHLEKGRDFLNNGHLNEAIEELSKAASLDHMLGEARTLLGVAYESKGLHQVAMKSFEAAVEADNKNPQHLNNLGYALYTTGDYEGATKYLKRALKLAPDDARIWNNLGSAQSERGKFNDAFQSFTHAVGEYKARVAIAVKQQRAGKTKDAINNLEKARALKPTSPEALAQLVKLYELTGRSEQAEDTRRSLIAAQTLANAPVPN